MGEIENDQQQDDEPEDGNDADRRGGARDEKNRQRRFGAVRSGCKSVETECRDALRRSNLLARLGSRPQGLPKEECAEVHGMGLAGVELHLI